VKKSLIESFRPVVDYTNHKQRENIESNWKLISGGLCNHNQGDHINLYGIIHMIRQIDDYSFFPITTSVYEICIQQEIDLSVFLIDGQVGYRLDKAGRQKINRLLNKKQARNDYIQIEHLNGGVKTIAKKLITADCKDWKSLQKIHFENTLCCCKLRHADNHINHKTDLLKIDIK